MPDKPRYEVKLVFGGRDYYRLRWDYNDALNIAHMAQSRGWWFAMNEEDDYRQFPSMTSVVDTLEHKVEYLWVAAWQNTQSG